MTGSEHPEALARGHTKLTSMGATLVLSLQHMKVRIGGEGSPDAHRGVYLVLLEDREI